MHTDTLPTSTTRAQPDHRSRLAAIDMLRFVAAVAVVAYHFLSLGHHAWGRATSDVFPAVHRWVAHGSYGVQLFFVISGFVIFMSARHGKGVAHFVASRIGRLYPAYWVAVLLAFLFFAVVAPGRREVTGWELVVNLTMFQRALDVPDLDGVYWTLWAELRFYLLIVALMLLDALRGTRLLIFLVAWPIVGATAQLVGIDLIAHAFISTDASLFACGMALYLLYENRRSWGAWAALFVNVALALGYAGDIQAARIAANSGVRLDSFESMAAIAACVTAVAVCALTPLRNVSWRGFVVAGTLSYPLYLVHSLWGRWLIEHLHPTLGRATTFVVVLEICLLAAWALHHCVERPFGLGLRRQVLRLLGRFSWRTRRVRPSDALRT